MASPFKFRIGHGYDIHALGAERPLILAGVKVADKGPVAHSDGDVICHALIDALFGALGSGDMGKFFPDSDPTLQDISSLVLLNQAYDGVKQQGYEIGNLDVTVLLATPKLMPHTPAMRQHLASALQLDPTTISIKAKSGNGVDAIGRGEAIAAHAVVLLHQVSW